MPNDNPIKEEQYPNNPWGLIAFVFKKLGTQAIPIFLAAGFIFAIYMFWDQYTKKQAALSNANIDAQEEYRKRLKEARTDADTAYSKIYELTDKQIDGVGKLLNLQKTVETELELQRTKTHEERIKADNEVKRAKDAMNEAKRQIETTNAVIAKKQQLVVELNKKQKELESREKKFKEKSQALGKRVKEIDQLKTQHIELAKAILEEDSLRETTAYTIATEVRKEYFPNENPTKNWLVQFSKSPNSKNLDELQKLVGITNLELEPLLKTDLGFKLWIKFIFESEEGNMILYLGMVDVDEYGYKNALFINLAPLNGEKDKVFTVEDVEGTSWAYAAYTPNPNNWNQHLTYLIDKDYDEYIVIDTGLIRKENKWSVVSIMKQASSEGFISITTKILYGEHRELDFLTHLQLEARFPVIYRTAMEETEEFANAVSMIKRANGFSPPSIDKNKFALGDNGVNDIFMKILEIAVKKDSHLGQRLLVQNLDINILGRIAAISLKKEFNISRIEPIYTKASDSQPVAQIQQQTISQEEISSAPVAQIVEQYKIYVLYLQSIFDDETETAIFTFERASNEYGWILTEFIDNDPIYRD